MRKSTPITRKGVELAYRYLLGRPPESEKAYEYGLSAGTVETLRGWILNSPEFADKLLRDAPRAVARCAQLAQGAEAGAAQGADPAPTPPLPLPAPTGADAARSEARAAARAGARAAAAAAQARAEAAMAAFFARHLVIHTHIEKCAGSSLILGLSRVFGRDGVLDLRRPGAPSPRSLPAEQFARIRLVTGHFYYAYPEVPVGRAPAHAGGVRDPLARLAAYFSPGQRPMPGGRAPLYIATVRDPLARLVSYLGFVRRSPTHPKYASLGTLPIAGAVEVMLKEQSPFLRNGQCLVLSRSPRFAAARASIEENYLVVLPYNAANQIPGLFRDAFGLPRPRQEVWVNAAREPVPDLQPDAALAERLRGLNSEDQALFDWVRDNEARLTARAAERLAALVAETEAPPAAAAS